MLPVNNSQEAEVLGASSTNSAGNGPVSQAPAHRGACSFSTRLIYSTSLLASTMLWFVAIRAPLWLDETLSYWQVSGGFAKIWSRSALMPSSIGYLYTLWLAKSVLGASEIALKIPSTLALMGATYFLFRAVRELFDEETAFLASIFFALDANVTFAATDARPYGFTLLATNFALFVFLRWTSGHKMRQAVIFGAAAAAILYYHYLFAAILPVFAIYYLIARGRCIKSDWRQIAAVLVSFTLLVLPLIYRVASLYQARQSHALPDIARPRFAALNALAPQRLLVGFVITAVLAALARKIKLPGRESLPTSLLGPLLVLLPVGLFYAVSAAAAVHLVAPRYLTVWAPGIALTWALLTKCISSRWLRQAFCVGLVAIWVIHSVRSPLARWHQLTFKETHAFVNANLAENNDRAPVLVCSALIESDYEPLPTDTTSENALLSQVAYYPIHAPVVMLPMDVNDETVRIGTQTILAAERNHQRFLLVAAKNSYDTVRWFTIATRQTLSVRILGEFGETLVLEFRPNAGASGARFSPANPGLVKGFKYPRLLPSRQTTVNQSLPAS